MTQMFLIWLLLPAASAIMDCKTACDICQLGPNSTISCSLCRECRWTLKRRMMQVQLPNNQKLLVEGQVKFPSKDEMLSQGQVVGDQQKQKLKNLEKQAFKQVMEEYGWQAKDIVQADGKHINDKDEDCLPAPKDCLHENDESDDKKVNNTNKELIELLTNIKCPVRPQTECPTSSVTPRTCPPIIPCKKKEKLSWHRRGTSSTVPPYKRRRLALRQLVRLDADYTDEMGCPTQPICSEENSDYDYPEEETLTNTRPIRPSRLSSSTTCPDKPCKETSTSQPPIVACVPCMPPCTLPCGPGYPHPFLPSFPPPFLPAFPSQAFSSIPQEAIQALLTVHTTTAKSKIKKLSFTTKTIIEDSDDDEEEEAVLNVSHATKKVTEDPDDDEEEESMLKEETTKTEKDYIYLYVGIPKDVKKLRRG